MKAVKMLFYKVFDRRAWAQETFQRGVHDHALADARTIGCDLEPLADLLDKPDGHFADRPRLALSRRYLSFGLGWLHSDFGVELHVLVFPHQRTRQSSSQFSQYDRLGDSI